MVEKKDFRNRIIETASKIFSNCGYRKTTMDDIALALNKGKSSIYYYFKCKEEIFEAVVAREARQLGKIVISAVNKASSPVEKIKSYVTARMSNFSRFTNLYQVLRNDLSDHLSFARKFRTYFNMEEVKLFQKILHEGNSKKAFHIQNEQLVALAIVQAMQGIEAPLLRDFKGPKASYPIFDTIDIILYGIVRR